MVGALYRNVLVYFLDIEAVAIDSGYKTPPLHMVWPPFARN